MCILRIIGVTFRVVWAITSSGGGGPKCAGNCESCVKVRNENYGGGVALRTHCGIMYILLKAELRRVTVPHADLKYEYAVRAAAPRLRLQSPGHRVDRGANRPADASSDQVSRARTAIRPHRGCAAAASRRWRSPDRIAVQRLAAQRPLRDRDRPARAGCRGSA